MFAFSDFQPCMNEAPNKLWTLTRLETSADTSFLMSLHTFSTQDHRIIQVERDLWRPSPTPPSASCTFHQTEEKNPCPSQSSWQRCHDPGKSLQCPSLHLFTYNFWGENCSVILQTHRDIWSVSTPPVERVRYWWGLGAGVTISTILISMFFSTDTFDYHGWLKHK